MSTPLPAITRRLVLGLVGPETWTPLEAELCYDPADPYAVTLSFRKDGAEVVWVFGRDLLLRGVSEPVGHGDVLVFPSLDDEGRALVAVALRSPTGEALVEGRTRDVLEFLAHTTRAVWPGSERDHQLSTDAAIAALLVRD